MIRKIFKCFWIRKWCSGKNKCFHQLSWFWNLEMEQKHRNVAVSHFNACRMKVLSVVWKWCLDEPLHNFYIEGSTFKKIFIWNELHFFFISWKKLKVQLLVQVEITFFFQNLNFSYDVKSIFQQIFMFLYFHVQVQK